MTRRPAPMTPAEFARRMRAVAAGRRDPEKQHLEGDALLVEALRGLGYGEGCDAFMGMQRWCA